MSARRDFLRHAVATTGGILAGLRPACAAEPKPDGPPPLVFSLLHTNDLHSSVLGVGPVTDYRPGRDSDDKTLGGYARLATLIRERRQALAVHGPVLVLDAGDFSVGSALGAAGRFVGAELQLMARMGYDATTLGDHEFAFGPEGLGQMIRLAMEGGPIPSIVAANLDIEARGESLGELRRLTNEKIVQRFRVVARGGVRFGIFGVIGEDAQRYAPGPGLARFRDPVETARTIARQLREVERVDVVICLSHGGLRRDAAGIVGGEDLALAEAVPDVDVVVGGHTHTLLTEPLRTSHGALVVQAHCYGQRLGELVVALERGVRRLRWFRSRVVDAALPGDPAIDAAVAAAITKADRKVFAGYGYQTLQPLVVVTDDLPGREAGLTASTPLGNVVADAIREATGAEVGLTLAGALRMGLRRGRTGRQTVYDVFEITPFGFGLVDPTAGSALVTAYFTGRELKNVFEFFLADEALAASRYFPRVSGLRVHYGASRPRHDRVTRLESADGGGGYRAIDITGTEAPLFGLSSNVAIGLIVAAIPALSKGRLHLVPKSRIGAPLDTRLESAADPRTSPGPYFVAPRGQLDPAMLDNPAQTNEIKEWQAVMDYLRRLPDKDADGVSILRIDDRRTEVRVIRWP